MKISENKKEAGRYCCAYGCRNEPIKRKGGLCHKHYARKIRENDPVLARYNQWKSSAIQRGKEFAVSLEEFRQFCKRTGYIVQKGRRGYAATLDRIDSSRGYSLDNLQILSNRANAAKGNRDNIHCPF